MTNLSPELLSALRRRYGDRPDRLAEVVAAAESWVRLRAVSDDGPSPARDTRNGDPQHWVPANFRKGTILRPKRGFPSEEAAMTYARENGTLDVAAYQCSTCSEWHFTSTTKRRRT